MTSITYKSTMTRYSMGWHGQLPVYEIHGNAVL
ncbi:MAG: hypothetical protein ACI9MC_000748 [Kiritimatiellia bacterium]|jgi:hypothetical protein